MKPTIKRLIPIPLVVTGALLSLTATSPAQHYPAGVEGIKAASLPPPGVYLRDYNFVYYAEHPRLSPLTDVMAYVNAPRLIWITGEKFLGADYGMDIIVPFGYQRIEYSVPGVTRGAADRFGLADIQVEPLLLSWHFKQFDVAAGYAFWAPTGDFDTRHLVNIGSGFWTQMLTAGATWYPDEAKTWALSILNRYEISQEQKDTHVTPGQMLTVEWGISKTVAKTIDVGLVGYWQQQTTDADPGGTSLSHAVAVGPEVAGVIPKIGVIASLRYLREVEVKDRTEGNVVTLTLTKRF